MFYVLIVYIYISVYIRYIWKFKWNIVIRTEVIRKLILVQIYVNYKFIRTNWKVNNALRVWIMRFHYSCSQNLKAWKSVEKSKTSKFESLRDVRDVLIKLQKNKSICID